MTGKQQSKAQSLAATLNEQAAEFLEVNYDWSVTAEEAAAELHRLHQVELAYQQWSAKTEWVQETVRTQELGLHRADVLKKRIDDLTHKIQGEGGYSEALIKAQTEIVKLIEENQRLRQEMGGCSE